MRIWHQLLIPYLPQQWLLGQHRELCSLRGKGWLKHHPYIDYVFNYSKEKLIAYHLFVLKELQKRNIKMDPLWWNLNYRGKNVLFDKSLNTKKIIFYFNKIYQKHILLYTEQGYDYLLLDVLDLNRRVPKYEEKYHKRIQHQYIVWKQLDYSMLKQNLYPLLKRIIIIKKQRCERQEKDSIQHYIITRI